MERQDAAALHHLVECPAVLSVPWRARLVRASARARADHDPDHPFDGNPLLAYNTAFLLAFVLSGLAAHFWRHTITRRHDLSFVAGLAFSFAPYRLPQIAHVQVLSAYWMPLALAGLHRYFGIPRRGESPHWPTTRWLVLFAGAWLMQALACGYYLFFLSVLVGLWLGVVRLFRGAALAICPGAGCLGRLPQSCWPRFSTVTGVSRGLTT